MLTSGLLIEFEHPVSNKVTELSPNCLALTSGNALAHTELFNAVSLEVSNLKYTPVEQLVSVVKGFYQTLRRQQIIDEILAPLSFSGFEEFYSIQHRLQDPIVFNVFSQIENFDYGLEILIGGVTGQNAHLYYVRDPGTSRCVDSVGFHAIGSGMNLAMSSLISDQCHQELLLPEALLISLKSKITSENAPGVGRKTDVSLMMPGKPAVHFLDREIVELKDFAKKGDIEESGDRIADMIGVAMDRALKNFGTTVSNTEKVDTILDEEKGANGNDTGESAQRSDDTTGGQAESQGNTRQDGATGKDVPIQD